MRKEFNNLNELVAFVVEETKAQIARKKAGLNNEKGITS
jgi:hypothetical protein